MSLATLDELKAVEERLSRFEELRPGAYSVSLLRGWDQGRLRVLVASFRHAPGVFFALARLANGRTVVTDDEGALPAALAEAFPSPQPEDAAQLALLATALGRWPRPVGDLVRGALPATPKRIAPLPRLNPDPVWRRDGSRTVVDFYTFEPELLDLFTCTLELAPERGKLSAEQLTEPRRVDRPR